MTQTIHNGGIVVAGETVVGQRSRASGTRVEARDANSTAEEVAIVADAGIRAGQRSIGSTSQALVKIWS